MSLIPGPGSCCPVCSGPGEPVGWRGLNLLYRCQQCGQHFVLDSLGSLEADLEQGGPA